MNAVIYARLERWEVDSKVLEGRVTECREWSATNGLQVLQEFTDQSCSGAHLDRPGFTQLCEFVIKRNVPIIIPKLSQLTTNVRDAELIADVFDELGICVYSVVEGLITVPHLAKLDGTTTEKGRYIPSRNHYPVHALRSGIVSTDQIPLE